MIDVSALKDWLGLIALMISIGTSVVLFVGSGSKKNAEDIGKLDAKVDDHADRLSSIETNMQHMPSKETVTKLQVDMAAMKGQIDSIAKTSEATERATRRVEDFLMKQKS